MNAGRLHAALEALKQDFKHYKIVENLQQLQTSLQQSVSTPNATTAKEFKEQFGKVVTILNDCPLNYDTPTRQGIYKQIGVKDLIGINLLESIEDIIKNNQVTPADALTELTELVKQVTELNTKIDGTIKSLEFFNIEYDELTDDEVEVGISIPMDLFDCKVEGLRKELTELDNALRFIKETVGDDLAGTKIKTTSNTDWQIFLDVVPNVAACIAIAIERIVALYKNNLEIQKLKLELEEKKLPKKITKSIEEHLKESITTEMNKIATELVNELYTKDDAGRKNELITGMTNALQYMADRIDKGCTFEVRAAEPEEPEKPEGGTEDEVKYKKELESYKSKKEFVDKINNQGRAVSLIKGSDEPIRLIKE